MIKVWLCVGLLTVAACGSKGGKDGKDADKDGADAKSGLSQAQRNEAMDQIAAISRGAMSAYEREREVAQDSTGFSHAVCKSASLVPAKVPAKGEKVKVADDAWDGDANAGWKCLKYKTDASASFQYSYLAGGGYKGLDRGAKDPGANGVQICAEADGKPGGKTLLICMSGAVNEKKSLQMVPDLETFEE